MTKEEIIRMAQEAGGYLAELPKGDAWLFAEDEYLERFAALVASAERDRMCEQFNLSKELAHEKAKSNEAS